MDRININVEVRRVDFDQLSDARRGEASARRYYNARLREALNLILMCPT